MQSHSQQWGLVAAVAALLLASVTAQGPPTYAPPIYDSPGTYGYPPTPDSPGTYGYSPFPDSPGTEGPATSDGFSDKCYDVSGLDLAGKFDLGGCDGQLPARLCLGDKYFSSGDYIYQLWFRMTNGTKLGFSKTNHATYLYSRISFIATSDVGYNRNTGHMNCRILSAEGITLDLESEIPSISVVETCDVDGNVVTQVLKHSFAAPSFGFPYCTPQLVADFVPDAAPVASPPPPPPSTGCYDIAAPEAFADALDLEPCDGQLPAQLCLGSAYFKPGDSIFQLWFRLQNGTKLGASKTNHGTFVDQPVSFISTSNLQADPATGLSTCRILDASDITLSLSSSPPSMSVVETCEYQGSIVKRIVLHTFAPPPFSFGYCTPQLVATLGSAAAGRKLMSIASVPAAKTGSLPVVALAAAGLVGAAMVVVGAATWRRRGAPQ